MKGQLLKRQSLTFCEQGAFINHPDRRTRALLTSTSEPCSGRSEGLMCTSLCKDTGCFHVCWVNIRNLSLEFGDVCVIQKLQESHTLQSAFPSFSRTNDKNNNNKKNQETCSQIICLDFSSGPWVRGLSYIPHGVKEIHKIDLFFASSFFFFLHFYLL